LVLLSTLVGSCPISGQTGFDVGEFQARRQAALEKIPDGILLLRSYSGLKHWDESGFHQDSSFYYFTGLTNAHSAILVLDGEQKQSWLFVAPRQGSQGADLHGFDSIVIDPGPQAQAELKIDHVVLWDELVPFIESRRKNNAKLILYGDSAGQTGRMSGEGSVPRGLDPMENAHWVWGDMLRRHWPDLEMKDAFNLLDEVRAVKSVAELERLRQAATITEKGFWAGVRAIGPGKTQRMVEGKVLDACLEAGSDGPSLWPWVRSGPNTMGNTLFEALADYHNMDRKMQSGEVVRLDVGCDFGMYKGDFGRTIPVSGHFDDGQRETMELLNGAYLAGVSAMRPGGAPKDVFQATLGYVEQHRSGLKTTMAKEAAEDALKRSSFPLHGLGLDMAEGAPKVFQKGNIICYEPLFSTAGQGFFVEDTFLITAAGHEVLSPALPYAPQDIEKSMNQKSPN
jgi:Xaa-Pro aminopeptidase